MKFNLKLSGLGTVMLLAHPAMAQTGQEMVAAMDQARQAYRQCVMDETLRLGRANHETADTILRAVSSRCAAQWQTFSSSFPDGGGVALAAAAKSRALEHVRKTAEDDAVAALLDARYPQRQP